MESKVLEFSKNLSTSSLHFELFQKCSTDEALVSPRAGNIPLFAEIEQTSDQLKQKIEEASSIMAANSRYPLAFPSTKHRQYHEEHLHPPLLQGSSLLNQFPKLSTVREGCLMYWNAEKCHKND